MDDKALWELAVLARGQSHSPYSGFSVGAALLCDDGEVFLGCNVENSAYGATNCAERTAFFSAVAAGRKGFEAIAIAGGAEELEVCYPCGTCRQVMTEFCDPEAFRIICGKSRDALEVFTLEELLPKSFKIK